MLRVRDIMTPTVYTVDADASSEEAAWGLTRLHLQGAPVRDSDGSVVGFVSGNDLADPGPREWIHGEPTVRDLMDPNVPALFTEDPALYAAQFFTTQDLRRAAVFDENGRLAGIVTPMDIVRALAHGQSFDLDLEDEEVEERALDVEAPPDCYALARRSRASTGPDAGEVRDERRPEAMSASRAMGGVLMV
ncbi:MAG TPA: CBS domain-containing protein [Polyangia bacterium]|jgi:CBS-domain-containing membrane protein|nr:CBS domain-containing protein [Polyangia bacterium]